MPICTKCQEEKDLSYFSKRYDSLERHRSTCKKCDKKARKKVDEKKVKECATALKNKPCQKCNKVYLPIQYDFHHKDPKQKEINISKIKTLTKLEVEIKKCELLCANCHKETHYEMEKFIIPSDDMIGKKCPKCNKIRNNNLFYKKHTYCRFCVHNYTVKYQRKFKQQCVDYKGGKCQECGYSYCLGAMEFHHRNPLEKKFKISSLIGLSFKKNFDKIKKELDKCDLLCSNCHRLKHKKLED